MRSFLIFAILASIAQFGFTKPFIENYGYQDVVVTISPDIPEADSHEIIEGIKSWISSGSQILYTATDRRAYMAHVRILIPASWENTPANLTGDIALEDGAIRVEEPNPLYGSGPYTVQTGGCGTPGEAIHVTPEYFTELDGLSTEVYGLPGHVFAHEWSKYRYGVFEEFGYPGDKLYPAFYINPRNQSELLPNYCTYVPLNGQSIDITTGGQCNYDNITGMPDDKCVFIPGGDNSKIESSLLATPFLENTEYFCDQSESHHHDKSLPNKQNTLCKQQSTLDVVMHNNDFNATQAEGDLAPKTEFEILRPDVGKFVLVLDCSGSMNTNDRIDYLRQSIMRWIQQDIYSGSLLGIVQFSSFPEELQQMTPVDDSNREDMMNIVNNLSANGGTCLGAAVKAGIETMSSTGSGGVMIFFTDGQQSCGSPDNSYVDDPEVEKMVIESKIRVITIAIGPDADDGIEHLSDISDGKAYFIPDNSGIGTLIDALQASLTYQPAVETENMEFVIFKEDYGRHEDIIGSFFIDKTIGRDVEIQVDYVSDQRDPIKNFLVTFPNGTEVVEEAFEDVSKVYIIKYDFLEEGNYSFAAIYESSNDMDSSFALVKSKSKDSETKPFTMSCWFSTSDGSNIADLSEGDPVAVIAQVMQGERPVMNAVVRALIEKEGAGAAVEEFLYDNGSGPDLTANDGLYSRYLTTFEGDNRYLLRCQVESTDQTEVNGGFIATKKVILPNGRTYSYPGKGRIPCCGSDAYTGNSVDPEPTGKFVREATGGSINVMKGMPIRDVIPPSSPRDLRVTQTSELQMVQVTFTAPGDDYDDGIATTYKLFYSTSYFVLSNFNYSFASELTDVDFVEGSLTPVAALTPVKLVFNETVLDDEGDGELEDTYYFRMTFTDEMNNVGTSNMDSITFSKPVLPDPPSTTPISTPPTTTTITSSTTKVPDDSLSAGAIAGIVIGAVAGVGILAGLAYILLKKKKHF